MRDELVDHFAALAMQGLLARSATIRPVKREERRKLALEAYDMADAMLSARYQRFGLLDRLTDVKSESEA